MSHSPHAFDDTLSLASNIRNLPFVGSLKIGHYVTAGNGTRPVARYRTPATTRREICHNQPSLAELDTTAISTIAILHVETLRNLKGRRKGPEIPQSIRLLSDKIHCHSAILGILCSSKTDLALCDRRHRRKICIEHKTTVPCKRESQQG